MIRVLAVVLACASVTAAASADPVADWIADQSKDHRDVLSTIRGDETLMSYTSTCPADVFPGTGRRAKGSKNCADNPNWCLTLCRAGHGNACFGVARAIETEMDDEGEATLKFPMFMAACADGNANGCTNAAAAAKNGSWIEGTRPAKATNRQCQFRTYEAACAAGASWGCYMLGLEWAYEGVDGQTNLSQARAVWQRSCDMNPDGGGCEASRAELSHE